MDKDLGKIIEQILASYMTGGGTNNIDGSNLPSKRALAAICEDLLQLLFPGFHDQEPIHSQHLRRVTSHRIFSIADRLREEVSKSLRLREPGCPEERATEVVHQFLETVPFVRSQLRTDVEAAFAGDPAAESLDEIILAYPYLEAIAIQRSAHMLYCHKIPLIPRMMTEWAHSRTGIDIHPGAHINSHFFIDHGTGVVIGETSVIGQHVKLYQGVSLVARSLAGGQQLKGIKRHPTLEDNVTVYAGTTVIGGETVVGAGSTIGANVFLTHSVPPRSLVVYEENSLRILNKDKRPEEWVQDWVI
ncbi:MAG TPA: serine acetyltransferase [Chthoniobacteraceae bacterium]|jgi:serine O-acetyltransferase